MPRNWRGRFPSEPATAAPVAQSAPGPDIDQDDDSDPFPCTQCDKGFTSQRGLSRHITAVHVEAGPLD